MASIIILEDGSVVSTAPIQAPTPPSLDSVCGRAEAAAQAAVQEVTTSNSTPITGD